MQGNLNSSAANDPAEPYYGVMDPSLWVSKEDAEFVDIIHVNSDTLFGVSYSKSFQTKSYPPNPELFNILTKLDNSELIQRSFKSNLMLLFLREACPCMVRWATSTSIPMVVSTSPAATTSWVWISLISSPTKDAATCKLLVSMYCRKGCYLEKMFCKQSFESSPCLPGPQDSCSTTVEISEKSLQNLFSK